MGVITLNFGSISLFNIGTILSNSFVKKNQKNPRLFITYRYEGHMSKEHTERKTVAFLNIFKVHSELSLRCNQNNWKASSHHPKRRIGKMYRGRPLKKSSSPCIIPLKIHLAFNNNISLNIFSFFYSFSFGISGIWVQAFFSSPRFRVRDPNMKSLSLSICELLSVSSTR